MSHNQSQQGDKGKHRIGVDRVEKVIDQSIIVCGIFLKEEFVTLLYNNYKNSSIQKENQRKFYILYN